MTRIARLAPIALAGALIIVAFALVASDGDADAMALGMCAALILVAPFAMIAPGLPHNIAYRSAMGIALAATFILFWMIGAVNLMTPDDEQHPNDVMYILVPVVGTIGAAIARFQPRGMARAMAATALVQMLVPSIVVIAGLNLVPVSLSQLVWFTLMVNGPFAAMYLGSAWLFGKADRVPARR